MEDFKSIRVKKGKDGKHLEVRNPTSYPLIGQGFQGAVFRLNEQQCVKIYADPTEARNEALALMALQEQSLAPKVFETGPNYIIMEYLKGKDLGTYLRDKGMLPEAISQQILRMIKEMKRAGFSKIDHRMKHFIVTEQEVLRVIDLVNVNKKDPKTRQPIKLLKRLKELGLLPAFLEQAKKLEPGLYEEWEQSIRFDEL